jgi:hypothetical protein
MDHLCRLLTNFEGTLNNYKCYLHKPWIKSFKTKKHFDSHDCRVRDTFKSGTYFWTVVDEKDSNVEIYPIYFGYGSVLRENLRFLSLPCNYLLSKSREVKNN